MKLLTIALASILSATALNAQKSEQSAKTRVLIAMEQTDFKKKLVTSMEQILKEKGMEITVVKNSEKELKSYKAADYDLVFITNSGVMSKVRPWAIEWLDKNSADSSKILLHTTKTKKWQEQVSIDAISSASDKKQVSNLAKEYVTKLIAKQ